MASSERVDDKRYQRLADADRVRSRCASRYSRALASRAARHHRSPGDLCPRPKAFTIAVMGDSRVNLTHHFLIAMPSMADPHFAHTLIYVCEHNAKGRARHCHQQADRHDACRRCSSRSMFRWAIPSCVKRVSITADRCRSTAASCLHRPLGSWQSTLAISDDLGLTTSKDILEAVGHGEGPEDVLISLGYAGWSADQLEQEIGQNAWLTVAADSDVLFAEPAETRLPAAMKLLGIDFSRAVRRRRARVTRGRDGSVLRASRAGTILAFDFGTRRIGVAVGEAPSGWRILWQPSPGEQKRRRFAAIESLIDEWHPAAADCRPAFACRTARRTP